MRFFAVFAVVSMMVVSGLPKQVHAEDAWEYFSVQDALNSPIAQEKLEPRVKFFMKGQSHGKVSNITREYTANKRTRKFGRSTEEACQVAFISALMAFQDRAHRESCDTVIDLYSVTKDREFVSSDQFSCLVGGMVANVALRGKVGKR